MPFYALLKRISDANQDEDFEDHEFVDDLYDEMVNHSPNSLERAYNKMLKMNVSKENICREFVKAQTPFAFIVGLGDLELARIMISKGADVNMRAVRDYLPLHTACLRGDVEMAKLLLQNGADVTAFDGNGQSPLLAVSDGIIMLDDDIFDLDHYYEMTQLLVSYGAKLRKTSHYDMQIFLHAIKYANLDTVRVLANEADCDLNYRALCGQSCLHAAVISDEPGVLEYVIGVFQKENIDLNMQDDKGETPLMWACDPDAPYDKSVKMLLKVGADFRIKNDKGLTSFDLLIRGERNSELAWLHFNLGFDILLDCDEALLDRVVKSDSSWQQDIIAEIAKKELMGSRIDGKNLQVFNQYRKARSYRRLCKKQLAEMRKIKFYENVSFLDVLSEDQNKLREYAKNSELVKAFFTTKCNDAFPIYCARIRHKFFEIMSLNSKIDAATYVVCEAIKRPTMYEIMQHEIMMYMKDDDFLKILDFCHKA